MKVSPTPYAFSCNLYRTATLSAYIQHTDSKEDELIYTGIAEVGGRRRKWCGRYAWQTPRISKKGGGEMNILNLNPAFSALNKFKIA